MTYLQLVRMLMKEAAVNTTPAGLTTVINQTGEIDRCVGWVNDAWLEIQSTKKWTFLWEQADVVVPPTFNAVAGDIPADRWDRFNTFRVDPSSGQFRDLDYVPWQRFSLEYRTLLGDDSMSAWTIRPDNAFVLNSPASVSTTIKVQRYRNPQSLALDVDEPLLPDDLHKLIVWFALTHYADYDEAGNQRSSAVDNVKRLTKALNSRCLPSFEMGGSLLDNYSA